MPIKTSLPLSYTNYYVEQRKTKRVFLKQMAQLIDWESVSHTLEKYYPTGQSGKGLSSVSPLQDGLTPDLV